VLVCAKLLVLLMLVQWMVLGLACVGVLVLLALLVLC
jgi:hypothetical protein